MSTLDGALLSDEASGPQRVFEGDLVVPLMSPWMALPDLIRRSPHIWAIHCLSCKHLEKSRIFWHCYPEFENDLQSHLPAMQSLSWSLKESELRELPPAAIAALGLEEA